MRVMHGLVLALLVVAVWPAASTADSSARACAATCSDYPNQKAAQEAADTVDADGDGIYCESLPCPCSTEAGGGGGQSCTKPSGVQRLVVQQDQVPEHPQALPGSAPERMAVAARGQPARRRRAPRPATSRRAMVTTATSTRPQSVAERARASSAVATRAAGRPTCGTSRVPRTARTAARSARSCGTSATGRAFATCSVSAPGDSGSAGPLEGESSRLKDHDAVDRCSLQAKALARWACRTAGRVTAPWHGKQNSPRGPFRLLVESGCSDSNWLSRTRRSRCAAVRSGADRRGSWR
jgi:hypothetical protein